ncbi:hypothetical protein PUMCH_000302 [Australozyma saopauloensis]|uniref:LDB19 N-terminal domain-containing protein n=1 Tax=Australozyma saopauloensis TaxID=291208 RepID=A0AAX4H3G6_9ASCO|nr:hypothetical protein PUMCH_000302 [[Candida] saopauloensis]
MALLSRVLNHHSDKSPRVSKLALTPTLLRQSEDPPASFSLRIKLESPPIVLYGQAHELSGSILSGVLTLDVLNLSRTTLRGGLTANLALSPVSLAVSIACEEVMLEIVTLQLIQTFHVLKPFMPTSSLILACKNCAHRETVLAEWDISLLRCSFAVGSYAYPFSHLMPGLLTGSSKLGDASSCTYIRYELSATARSVDGKEVKAVLPLEILRSILRGPDKNSLRVFPPTEVVTSAVLPGVMYPKSTLPIELRMENIVNENHTRRWRMRKLLWKLQESTQVRAFACKHHQSKLESIIRGQRVQQESRSLRADPTGKKVARGGFESSSKISGMHHLTVQTLMFVSRPPASVGSEILPTLLEQLEPQTLADQDTEMPREEAPSNRISDEVVNFEEDFGITTTLQDQNNESNVNGTPEPQLQRPTNPDTLESDAQSEDLYFDELRIVGHGDVKSGWKSDFLGRGRIELVLDVNILGCSTGTRLNMTEASSDNPIDKGKIEIVLQDTNVACDIHDPVLGVYVSHLLIVEMIVAEEQIRIPRSDGLHPVSSTSSTGASSSAAGIPTGAARVLRMQFKVILTERSGLGIAWDDEVPPTYHDVKALSPPTYATLATNTPASLVGVSLASPTILFGVGDNAMDRLRLAEQANIDLITGAEDMIQELSL